MSPFRYLRFLFRVLWHTHRFAMRGDSMSAVWLFGRLCSAVEDNASRSQGWTEWTLLRLRGALREAQGTFISTGFIHESFHISKEPTHASDSSQPARPE